MRVPVHDHSLLLEFEAGAEARAPVPHGHYASMIHIELPDDEVAHCAGHLAPLVLLPVQRAQPYDTCRSASSSRVTPQWGTMTTSLCTGAPPFQVQLCVPEQEQGQEQVQEQEQERWRHRLG